MVLNPDVVSYFAQSMRDPNSFPSVLKSLFLSQRRVVTDETFFATVVMNHDAFKSTLPGVPKGEGLPEAPWLTSVRYERMDEHSPSARGELPDTQRYKAIEALEPRVWGPYFLGVYDLRAIKDSGALFVRKVSLAVEPNLYRIFPKGSRAEVEALPDVDWHGEIDYVISDRPTFPSR